MEEKIPAICERCNLINITHKDEIILDNITYSKDLPATTCTICLHVFFESKNLMRFENEIADKIEKEHITTPEALKFLNKNRRSGIRI